jgi:hypothetical protein
LTVVIEYPVGTKHLMEVVDECANCDTPLSDWTPIVYPNDLGPGRHIVLTWATCEACGYEFAV